MPVSAGTVQFSYVGDGVTTVFPFPSRFLSNSDIIVGVDGVQIFTGFTVTGQGVESGGNVTFSAAPAVSAVVTLIRAPAINQLLDFVNNQTVLAQNIDNGLDKLTIVAQYLDYLMARTIRLDKFDTNLTGDFDALGRRIKNAGAPSVNTDVVRLGDVQGLVSAAGNVPLPTGGQNDYFLRANGPGTFGWEDFGASLEALRLLVPAADRMAYFTGASTAALATLTAFARTLFDDADASAALTTLGVTAYAKTLLDDADIAAAAATLGFAQNLVVGGYQELPSGLIMQFGVTGSIGAGSSVTITLPQTFPTNIITAYATPKSSANNTNEYTVATRSETASSFIITNNSGTSGAVAAAWLAIGH